MKQQVDKNDNSPSSIDVELSSLTAFSLNIKGPSVPVSRVLSDSENEMKDEEGKHEGLLETDMIIDEGISEHENGSEDDSGIYLDYAARRRGTTKYTNNTNEVGDI